MQLIFNCPQTNRMFESEHFEIAENEGIKQDEQGNKFLEAKVILTSPCPFCGQKHIYQASELSCPLEL